MNSLLKLVFIAFLGGVIGSLVVVETGFKFTSTNLTQTIDQPPETISNTTTPDPELWEKIVTKISPTLVGIQTINGDRVIRQGSGIIVSSDGLIVTTANLWGPKGTVYQVFYDDKIIKGDIVDVNSKTNLLLLKTSVLNSSIAELNSRNYQSGQEIIIIGKNINLSQPVIVSQKGIISQATDSLVTIDTVPSKYLFGFGVSDKYGYLRGLVYLKNGAVNLIKTETIENFFKNYLEKISK